MNQSSMNTEEVNGSDLQWDKVVSNADYEIGEGSKIGKDSLFLGTTKTNSDVYNFQSSEELSDLDLVIENESKIRKLVIQYKRSSKTGKLLPCKVTGEVHVL